MTEKQCDYLCDYCDWNTETGYCRWWNKSYTLNGVDIK